MSKSRLSLTAGLRVSITGGKACSAEASGISETQAVD